ncbi:MAG: winged helix-turn-helix transcriptional regulator [Clostridiales bacterium]|nr:winged helix-turn-helix transcriptional regulator [Clostridiales bacterium]
MELRLFREQVLRDIQLTKTYMEKTMDPVVQSEGLTVLQALVLLGLEQGTVDNVSSLCHATGMGQANASTLCKKMEREGFLLRVRGKEDARVVTLQLADRGRNALSRMKEKFQAYDVVLQTIPPEKFDAVLGGIAAAQEILRRILAYQQANKGGTQSC